MLHDGRAIRVAVVGGSRIPFCRSHSVYRHHSNQDLMTAALDGLINKLDLKGQTLGEVALGAVIKHSRDWNLARECVIESGLNIRTPAVDLQRACGTSIEAAIMIANKIALGQIEAGIAGGTDTVSDAPIVFSDPYRRMLLDMHAAHSFGDRIKPLLRFRPGFLKPEFPGVKEPRTGLSMGESTEITAKEWDVQREHQDQLALASHTKAAAAYDSGWYDDLVVLDVQLPGCSGYEVLQSMRGSDRLRDVRVLMMSAAGGELARKKCLALGADLFMMKPFSTAQLTEEICKLLGVGVDG